jgi:hypothetical protein
MSQNEIIQLDANFARWKTTSGAGLKSVEPFLFYAVDNILKPYNLPFEDVRYGITDHANDGGIDALYILANRNTMVRDNLDLAASGTDRLRLIIFQSKSSESETGFKADDIDKFARFVDDLLDMSKDPSKFNYKYEGHLISIMQTYRSKYLSIAGNFPTVELDFYYVTRGDETGITKTEQDAIDRLSAAVRKHLGDSPCNFNAVNTQSLLKFVQKRRQRNRTLHWADIQPLPIGEGYVGLVSVKAWYEFLKDPDSEELDELIFESNVRGFRGNSTINGNIKKTLENGTANFWQLNNGVTIVSAEKLQPVDAMSVSIVDPQVVNGLQTSRVIFEYLRSPVASAPLLVNDTRSLLVRVLRITDETARNDVIKATNNQNPMQVSALRGTDNIHRQIEDLFAKYGYYYDRRPGYYRDKGVAIEKIVGYTELTQAVICLLMHRPDDARARPGNYLTFTEKGNAKYKTIFAMDSRGNAKQPLGFYLKAVQIIRAVDDFLESKQIEPSDLINLRFYLAYFFCSEVTQKLKPNAGSILSIDSSLINEQLEKSYPLVVSKYEKLASAPDVNRDSVAKGSELLKELEGILSEKYQEDAQVHIAQRSAKVRDVLRAAQVK